MRQVKGGVLVSFRHAELVALWKLAERRVGAKTPNARDKRVDQRLRPVQAHYVGLKAEYAVARYLGVAPDVYAYGGGDGGVDLRYRGRTIDVKNSFGGLVIPNLQVLRSDVIILVNPVGRTPDPFLAGVDTRHRFRDVIIRGWVTREQFEVSHTVKDFGHGPCLVMETDRINPMLNFGE